MNKKNIFDNISTEDAQMLKQYAEQLAKSDSNTKYTLNHMVRDIAKTMTVTTTALFTLILFAGTSE
tara:strand:+ start:683 stop:880 length:198 start_codon:yes stop_codon:yes gene_type:complete